MSVKDSMSLFLEGTACRAGRFYRDALGFALGSWEEVAEPPQRRCAPGPCAG